MKRGICSVGVSQSRVLDRYAERFRQSFAQFGCADELFVWDQDWPTGAVDHRSCNYGFKVHAMQYAADCGCDVVLWLDISCRALKPIDAIWARIERDGHALVEDANRLGSWSSDRSLEQFGVSRDEAMEIPLMCGTCWGLDLRVERSRQFLNRLREMATPENFNGTHNSHHPALAIHPRPGTDGAKHSTDARCWGHRADEVYTALLARELGMKTHVGVEFVGGGTITPEACVVSGYDL